VVSCSITQQAAIHVRGRGTAQTVRISAVGARFQRGSSLLLIRACPYPASIFREPHTARMAIVTEIPPGRLRLRYC